jgi:adenylate kinase family enzyme
MSLLEPDQKQKDLAREGIASSIELDKEIKEYMDANKIFKQLKTAF